MNTIWILTKREFRSFFDSLIAYILLVLFLGISGFFTWLFGSDVFFVGQASLRAFFMIAYWTLFFFIPALTMRLLAEEVRSGTIELLLTRAITDRQVVIGKFLSTLTADPGCPGFYLTLCDHHREHREPGCGGGYLWLPGTDPHGGGIYLHRIMGKQYHPEPDRGLSHRTCLSVFSSTCFSICWLPVLPGCSDSFSIP